MDRFENIEECNVQDYDLSLWCICGHNDCNTLAFARKWIDFSLRGKKNLKFCQMQCMCINLVLIYLWILCRI